MIGADRVPVGRIGPGGALGQVRRVLDLVLASIDSTFRRPSRFARRTRPQRVTKSFIAAGPAGVAMAFKLIDAAQTRWRMVNAPHLVALVRGGARFVNGKLVERPDDQLVVCR